MDVMRREPRPGMPKTCSTMTVPPMTQPRLTLNTEEQDEDDGQPEGWNSKRCGEGETDDLVNAPAATRGRDRSEGHGNDERHQHGVGDQLQGDRDALHGEGPHAGLVEEGDAE